MEEAGGQFIIRKSNGKKAAEVIAETARERNITQIVMGQSIQNDMARDCPGQFY
ncbi:hypothetical protein D1872_318450 [compost metagenome]